MSERENEKVNEAVCEQEKVNEPTCEQEKEVNTASFV